MAKKKKNEDDKKDPKSKTEPKSKTDTRSKTDSKPSESDKPKPTRGLDIGENFGWTGKLPLTLLNEHCQKQKWPRPRVDTRNSNQGVSTIITLTWTNPKTKELVSVRFNPKVGKPTAVESKHFCATYVMHRINYKKNMKIMLPNVFRDYWDELEAERNGRDGDGIYNENPFLAYLKTQEIHKQREKEREKTQEKIKEGTIVDRSIVNQINHQKNSSADHSTPRLSPKVWDNSPIFDIDLHDRIRIENVVKWYMSWTKEETKHTSNLKDLLMKLGFKPIHVDECLQYTGEFTKALEWLIFYFPEDDLPKFLMKSNYNSAFKVKLHKDWKLENHLKNLSESGFNYDDILTTWEKFENEHDVAIDLSRQLVPDPIDIEGDTEDWTDELESLKSMDYNIEYTDQIAIITMDQYKVRIYKPLNYPLGIPGIHILTNIPNYIKLHIVKNCLQYLVNNQYLGMGYIFTITDYLNENWKNLVENPGSLYVAPTKTISSSVVKIANNSRKFRVNVEKIKASYADRTKRFAQSISNRSKLPAWAKQEQILSLIKSCKNQVILVTGETGSGKSTQVIQFLLDDLNQQGDYQSLIMCSQPRRISTLGLADRVSDERLDKVGNEIGYLIRGESKISDSTRVIFVTTGVLIRLLNGQDSVLNQLKYVVIDEVHERSLDVDFVLILLKNLKAKFPKLTVILMSATVEKNKFDQFFKLPLDHIHIEGRTFPIETKYLDNVIDEIDFKMNINGQLMKPRIDSQFFKSGQINYDLLVSLCEYLVAKSRGSGSGPIGSLLIFLPGIYEINSLIKKLNIPGTLVLPLHSALTPQDQRKVFKSSSQVKIVISTNIAETSITIPDCTMVIDCGKVKTMYFDQTTNSTKLIEDWCSQAEAQQRRGRSGRVQAGTCYRMYSKETFDFMKKEPIPEIKRASINNMYLMIKAMGVKDVPKFLSQGVDPPSMEKVKLSEKYLESIGCIDSHKLTNLGKYVSLLPMDLNMGKLLILGCIFGCLDSCLVISSIKSIGTPFLKSIELRDANKSILKQYSKDNGDLIGVMNLVKAFIKSSTPSQFIKTHNLSYMAMKDIVSTKVQYHNLITDLKLQNDNRNDGNMRIIQAVITASYYPSISKLQHPNPKYFASSVGSVEVDPDARLTKYYINQLDEHKVTRVFVHPSSTMFGSDDIIVPVIDKDAEKLDLTPVVQALRTKHPFVVFGNSHETTKLYINEITPTTPIAVILFGGAIDYDLGNGVVPGIIIDKWITIRTWCKNAVLIKYLRQLLDASIDSVLSGDSNIEIIGIVERLLNA